MVATVVAGLVRCLGREQLCGAEFVEQLEYLTAAWLPARDQVEAALLGRNAVHSSGQIMAFEGAGMPWKDHLYTLERAHAVEPLVLFVIYTDSAKMWRVQAVTEEGAAFSNRLSLPESWRGLRDAELVAAAGIAGCKFVHAAGFIGGHETRKGAIAMAATTLAGAT